MAGLRFRNMVSGALLQEREAWIRNRAHALWEEKGKPLGMDLMFWVQAEAMYIKLWRAQRVFRYALITLILCGITGGLGLLYVKAPLIQKQIDDLVIARIIVLLAIGAILLFSILWFVPRMQIRSANNIAEIPLEKQIELEDKARATLAQVIGGTFFLFTAFFTWQGTKNAEKQIESAQEQLHISREGQLT